jgi:hypothetical protein
MWKVDEGFVEFVKSNVCGKRNLIPSIGRTPDKVNRKEEKKKRERSARKGELRMGN